MSLFYNILIVMGILITVIPGAILLRHRFKNKNSWEHKYKKTTYFITSILFLGTFLLLYGTFVEPLMLVTNTQKIDLPKINNNIKIALISDIHVGNFNTDKDVNKIADRILSLSPDIVLIGGDNVMGDYRMDDDRLKYLKPLERVASQIPTYAIHGNHDYGVGSNDDDLQMRFKLPNRHVEIKKAMEDIGIKYLVNETEKITIRDENFLLFGGDEYLSFFTNYDNLDLTKKQYPDLAIIAIIHNPAAVFEASRHGVDLLLSGHTHGGQVRLPIIGPAMHIELDIPISWYQGLNEFNGTKLFVTSGANESGVHARLFNPPEVVLLEIN